MKLHTNKTNIERGGVQGETSFTIKTNALSFSILSSGLYTDPILAVVRELSCNAYDAHVKANNKNTPFEIHLPNHLEPWLSVKDYGTGLHDDDIRGKMVPVMVENDNNEKVQATDKDGNPQFIRSGGLYTTYFDSTKTDSDDFIGALGLGSKSPFSYSDAFEVISRHGGKKRTYAIFLNEEGIPTVALMGEILTDEHNGLEVRITIKPDDFRTFKDRTASILKYFPVKPKVTGSLQFEFEKIPEHKIQTKDWMLAASSSGYHSSSFIAVQGNVPYRVDSKQIRNIINDEKLIKLIENTHIVTFFDIGDLSVSANREEIRYDKQSLEKLVERTKQIKTEITSEIENKISKISKKYWYACIELTDLSSEIFGRRNMIRDLVDHNIVKNKILKRYIKDDGDVLRSTLRGYSLNRYTVEGYYSKKQRLKRDYVSNTITPRASILWVFNDVKKGGLARIREYLCNNNYTDAIVISKNEEPIPELKDGNPVKYIGFKKEYDKLCEELGHPDIHNISEITEEIVKEPSSKELTVFKYHTTYFQSYYSKEKIDWQALDVDINSGGLFFPIKFRSKICMINEEDFIVMPLRSAKNAVNTLQFLIDSYNQKYGTTYTLQNVYGMPVTTYKKAKKVGNWINIFDFAKEILPQHIEGVSFNLKKKATPSIHGVKDQIRKKDFIDGVKSLRDDSVFKKALMPLIEGNEKFKKSNDNNIEAIECLYGILLKNVNVDKTPFYDEYVFLKYPMLTLIEDLEYTKNWSIFFDYINLIDRS